VREEVKRVIQETLQLTIAEEKSHIRHSKDGIIFVGYWVKTYSGDRVVRVKRGSRHTTFKSVSERLQLHIPKGRLQKFCDNRKYGASDTFKTRHKPELTTLSDAEIILAYNGELRGLANSYALACHVKSEMSKLAYIWQNSLFKTLGFKHKTSVSKIAKSLKTEDGHALILKDEKKTRIIKLFRLKDLKTPLLTDPRIDTVSTQFVWTLSRSELIRRLNARKCE
jgi:RNA-directed DNA polymerase